MPLLKQVIAGRVLRPPAELQGTVGIEQPGTHDGCIVRKQAEISDKAPRHVSVNQSVVVEYEAVFPTHMAQCQVVVFGKAAQAVALYEIHPGKIRLRAGKVLRLEKVGDHKSLIAYARMLPYPLETGIQVVKPVHADYDYAEFRCGVHGSVSKEALRQIHHEFSGIRITSDYKVLMQR